MGHRDNRSYIDGLRARGLLKDTSGSQPMTTDGQLIALLREMLLEKQKNAQPQSIEAATINKALDLLSTTYKTGMENTIASMVKPDNSLAVVKEVIAAINAGRGEGGNDILTTLLTTLLAQQAKLQESNTTLLVKLIESRDKGGDTGLGVVDKVIGLIGKVRELSPGDLGGTAAENRWGFFTEVARQLPVALGQLSTMMYNGFAFRAGAKPAQPLVGNPAEQPPAQPSQPAALPAPVNPTTTAALTPEQTWVLDRVGPALVEHVKADDPHAGLTFAAWIDSMGYGDMLAMKVAALGKEELSKILRLHPDLWNSITLLGGEAKLGAFLDDFCQWPQVRQQYYDGVFDQEDEPVPTGKAKKK